MTTAQLILCDHLVALLCAAAWSGSAVATAGRRRRLARYLFAGAALLSLTRVVTVVMLSGRGWWFAEEKVLLGLPMLALATAGACVLAGPTLFARRHGAQPQVPTAAVVALFTVGYAAVAGLVVTLTAGYPSTWGTGLVAVVCVGAATLLTARVVTTPTTSGAATGQRAPVSRRGFLNVAGGIAVAGAGAAGLGVVLRPAEGVSTGAGYSPSGSRGRTISVAELRGPASPAPGGTIRRHVLTAQQSRLELAAGREVDAWTYNGQSPGPEITATEGDLVEVHLRNADIEAGVTVHWHGYDVPCGEDGVPGLTQHVVMPGGEFVYRFRADQVGTYWYHTHHASHVGVRRGLYGTLVVHPRDGLAAQALTAPEQADAGLDLTVPIHTFDGFVAIGDQDGRLERRAVPGAHVRVRLVNTDSDPHRFALVGTRFRVSAVDGRNLHHPGELGEVGLRLAAGGRYDLVFVMPANHVLLSLDDHGPDDDKRSALVLSPTKDDSPAAGSEPEAPDTSGWPELDLLNYGTPAAVPFDARRANRHFTMVLDRGLAMVDGTPAYGQTVNGRAHPSIPDQLVAEGDIVRLTVVNRSLETHPWHLHGHAVLVLARDGRRAAGSPLWLDTFDVRPGEVWDVAFQAGNRGIWMNHCHNLPHAEHGMMLRLRYDGVETSHHN